VTRRHIAVFGIPAIGHVIPTLGMVAELVRRGHRVTYAAAEPVAGLVRETGADVLNYTTTLTDISDIFPPDSADWLYRIFLASLGEARATMPGFQAHFAADPPDLVAYDSTALMTGRVLAWQWHRPAVEMDTTFASNDHFSLATLPEFARTEAVRSTVIEVGTQVADFLRKQGMGDIPVGEFLRNARGARLVFLPRAFQIAGETFGSNYAFVGACLRDSGGHGAWEPPASGEPVVLISLGTVFNRKPEFFRDCARAFAGLPWHVVMMVGDQIDPARLGPLPGNVEVHQWLSAPLSAVIRHAAVVVCHAGMGSVMESLFFGVPLVVIPLVADQPVIADRIAELGLGRALHLEEASGDAVRDAVLALARDEGARRRAKAMGDQIRAAGGAARAADTLEGYLADPATSLAPRVT
jgi:MGT family glycosyltransferase